VLDENCIRAGRGLARVVRRSWSDWTLCLPNIASALFKGRIGTRNFQVDVATAAGGRIRLTAVSRDSTGALRSQIDASIATDDLNLLAQVLGGELKTLAAWQKRPSQSYADMIEQARRMHGNAYLPWSASGEQLVAQFRAGVPGRLEQLGEIAPVRADPDVTIANRSRRMHRSTPAGRRLATHRLSEWLRSQDLGQRLSPGMTVAPGT
jgi:hypothetical protein